MSFWLERVYRDFETLVVGREVIGPKPAATVVPPPRFAWDEKRWQRRASNAGMELVGQYRVFDRKRQRWRTFDGQIVQQGTTIATYIAHPPVELSHHRHAACLQLVEAPWFRLHWDRIPRTLDDALLYMERMLDESINGRRR